MAYRYIHKLTTVAFLAFLVSCGGGSSGGASDSDIAAELTRQSSKTVEYVAAVEKLMISTQLTENKISSVDYTDVTAVLSIADEIDSNNALAEEIYDSGKQLGDIETLLLAGKPSLTGFKSPLYLPEENRTANALGAVVLGVCALGLTATSWGLSLNENIKTVQNNRKQCADTYRDYVDRFPAGLTDTEENELLSLGHQALEACYEAAKSEFYWQYFKDTTLGFASVFGPGQIPAGQGRILFQSISGAGDVTTIYVIGTQPEAAHRSANRHAIPTGFIAQSDLNGTVIVPEGEWNLVAVTPGSVRFGTSAGQTIPVSAGQTTVLDAVTRETSSSDADNIASCGGNGGGSSDIINVLALKNFGGQLINNPTADQIASADVQLSSNISRPVISWNFSDAVIVDVVGNSIDNPAVPQFLYGIQGIFIEEIADTGIGSLEVINSPLQYGDYSVFQTEVLDGFSNPSPDLTQGETSFYTVTVRTEGGDGASITFSF